MLPRSVLVAFDFSDPSRRALDWARTLRARLAAGVWVVHVHDPARSAGRSGEEERGRLEEAVRREVDDVFGPDAQAVRVLVASGLIVERLHELALELGADLLIAGSTGKDAVERVLLGSVTEELIRRSAIPVMIVH